MPSSITHFIDFEASSLRIDSYPIEIGVCGPGVEISALIKPDATWTDWDSLSEELHGISQIELEEQGVAPLALCKQLNDALEGRVLWCDSNHDAGWLDTLYRAAGMKANFEIKNIFNLISFDDLPDDAEHALGQEHRALADAKALQACWQQYEAEVNARRALKHQSEGPGI